MADPIKSEYYRFDGTSWGIHYFRTTADLILETGTYKVLTKAERTLIANNLTNFNGAGQLVKINASDSQVEPSKIPSGLIPALAYLPLTGGTISENLTVDGAIDAGGNVTVGGTLYLNGGISSDGDVIGFGGSLVDMEEAEIINLKAPTNGGDAVNKAYVDGLVSVGVKPVSSVVAATTQNVALLGLGDVDGVTLTEGARVLVWKQDTASENGIYIADLDGWSRVDIDSNQGAYVFVNGGTLYNDWYFYCTSANTWVDHARPDTVGAGAGLSKTGNTLAIKSGGVTSAMIASVAASKILNWQSDDDNLANFSKVPAAATGQLLSEHVNNLYNAIRLIRGQANYNTESAETIAGAYVLATGRNRTFVASDLPTNNTVYNAGDVLFKTIPPAS